MRKLLPVQSFLWKPLRNCINLLGLSSWVWMKIWGFWDSSNGFELWRWVLDELKHYKKSDKENVTVTVRFCPLGAREVKKGDEIAWYADGDYTVRNEYNASIAYGFDRVFGPATTARRVYDVAAHHVVSGAMQGISGASLYRVGIKACNNFSSAFALKLCEQSHGLSHFEATTVVAVAPPVVIPAGSVLKFALAGGLSCALSTSLMHLVDIMKEDAQKNILMQEKQFVAKNTTI